jgi:hypothetical protein
VISWKDVRCVWSMGGLSNIHYRTKLLLEIMCMLFQPEGNFRKKLQKNREFFPILVAFLAFFANFSRGIGILKKKSKAIIKLEHSLLL